MSSTARNPTATFSQPLQMPIPPVPPARSRPTSSNMGAAAAQPNVNGHYNELLSLLQHQGNPVVNRPIPQAHNTSVSRMQASNRLSFVPGARPTSTQALDPKALAALKRQHQIQAAQAKQRRESLANASSMNRNTPPVPIPRPQAFAPGISPVVSIPTMPSGTKQDSQHSSAMSAQQRPNSAVQPGQSRSITQEQVIVGHFCRHAIKTLKKIMEGLPYATQGEMRLREHIKAVWSQWVKGMITRPQLLQSVSNFVKQSTPAAKEVDVIKDFKAWYEHEYEQQKQRGRQTQQPPPKQVRNPQVSGQSVIRANNIPVHTGKQPMRPNMAPQPLTATRTQIKGETQRVNIPRTAGKSITGKQEPMRVVPARPALPKNVGARPGDGVGGRQLAGSNMARPQVLPVRPTSTNAPNIMVPSGIPSQHGNVNQVVVSKMPDGRPNNSSKGGQKIVGVVPQLAGKSVGGKSLLHNKTATQPKAKQPRRPPQKTAAKTTARTSPKGAGKGKSPAPYPFHAGVHPGGNVPINYPPHQLQSQLPAKRGLDGNVSSSPPNAAKKVKTISKPPKGTSGKKKPSAAVGNVAASKSTRPPVQRLEQKNKGAKRPMASGALPPSGPASVGPGNPGADVAQKKVRRQEDLKEINLVDNVVDIEDEEVKLNVDANGRRQAVEEVVVYNPDMIVSGPILRKKMQSIAKRHGINENINKEAIEMMSFAVRERLACILESLKTVASVRVGAEKEQWGRVETGLNIREKLQRAREDEERSLQVAAEMRVKRRKEQREAEAKRLAGEAAKNDKSAKDSSAAAEAERKEKLALEKKKKESSSQRDALSGLVRDYGRRRRRAAKPLAPLNPLGKPGLPPLVKRPSSDSLGRSGLKPLGSLDRLKELGPLVKLGRSNTTVPRGLGKDPAAAHVKLNVTLRDCLFLFESERNTKKSSLLYKWYTRLPSGK
ncbi:Transcription initiation factor TFIID [Gracilaria domingensis]|nr:Transcription initiation factor TFIID [Gracilaria domingensis]